MKTRIVIGQFYGGGVMPYFAESDIRQGDFAVIETNAGKLLVVKIIQTEKISAAMEKKASKAIIQRVNFKSGITNKGKYDRF